MKDPTITLNAAAAAVGVSAVTLRRWLLDGKVDEVPRNRNGWRVFSAEDIERIRAYAELTTQPERQP